MVRSLFGFLLVNLSLFPLSSTGFDIALNEVYYHDQGGSQWVEVYNFGADQVDLGSWVFSPHSSPVQGEYFVIPEGTVLPAQSFLLLCADVEAVKARFDLPEGVAILEYGPSAQNLVLETDGDDIYLVDDESVTVDLMWYGDGGDIGGDQAAPLVGFGHSLGRFPDGRGTGVPSADFYDYRDPTPGGPNPSRAGIGKSTWGKIKAMYSAKRR